MNEDVKKDIFKYTVLVVDEEYSNLQWVASILNPHYHLVLADNPDKVLEACGDLKPDLILLDILISGKSGFELARELKSNPKTSSIPIIFLTDKSDEEDIDHAFQLGGVDYISKPFKTKELLARVGTQIKLRSAEKRLRQAIDLVPHRFYAKDSTGNIILANSATAKFYEREVEDLLDKIEPPLPEGWVYVRMHEKSKDQENYISVNNYEEQLYLPDGTKKYFQTTKTPFPFSNSQKPAVLELSIDVTSEKEKKDEILKLNQQLMKHSRYKDKLFSLIAHDLRTPVLNTDMSLKLLLRRIDSLTKDEIIERIRKAVGSAESTINLLENLLEWSRAQFKAIRFNPQPLTLTSEIEKLLDSVQPQVEIKPINFQIQVDEGLKVLADEEMLQTILRNLVSNAIKFSEEQGRVIIGARAENDRVFISVTDFGVGINQEQLHELKQGNLEHITNFGTQGEKGCGIGINLAKEFIERHQGHLEIESREGKGSTFSFSLPVA